ncbi:hypothetical protein [Schumannella sp. 10F1B-5-1]|uniref:hypothetical protein n=1 Tax=Schumannella sp. 10F1B-5-1 TaxID=2590780 RepID=UPI0011302296|nr:hypothetical protein [Schumannella sp. 10F1B-5-1]TPW70930.1 hypothetical protein FJ658_12570 [Schumannella sp. 10F1B-5-1]
MAAAVAVLEIAPDLLGDEFGDGGEGADTSDDEFDAAGPAGTTASSRRSGVAGLAGIPGLRSASALGGSGAHPDRRPERRDGTRETQGRDQHGQGEIVQELQGRIRGMQRRRLDSRALPADETLGDLLPGGALAAGDSYAIRGSTSLALALLRAPSQAGSWCAIVGLPDVGLEAAAGLGLDLDRVVLVPHPGDHWMAVVSALVDVVSVVLVQPPLRDGRARVGETAATRLASRLRQREAVLLAMDDWPRAEARLAVGESSWSGIGAGFGHLTGRQATVTSVARAWAGRERSRRLWLPGADGAIAPVGRAAGGAANQDSPTTAMPGEVTGGEARHPRLRSAG